MASSKTSIYTALGANVLIAVVKFIGGGISNSSSMVSEGIHSLVDSSNQLLLLLGISRSKKAPDARHPFGYGRELYFWSFIVSIMIFGLGGGISVYQGIVHLRHPEPLGNPTLNYVVLSFAIVVEAYALWVATKEFNQARGNLHWWDAITKSKDPSSFLIVFEDAAAVGGLIIVLVCMVLNQQFDLPFLDGLASLLVGILLIIVSAILARESRSLLMGEGIAPENKQAIAQLIVQHPSVLSVKDILSVHQSPTEVVLMLIVVFKADLNTQKINEAIDQIRAGIKAQQKLVRFVLIQPETEHHTTYLE